MTRELNIKSIIILLMGVVLMSNLIGCGGNFKYERYTSKDPELNLTMDYISGWSTSEKNYMRQHNFVKVSFMEPKREGKIYTAMITVTVRDVSRLGFQPPTLDGFVDDRLLKLRDFQDNTLVSKSRTRVLGVEARDIEMAYKAPDRIYNKDAKIISVKERDIALIRDSKLYVFKYDNVAEDFSKFEKAFYHCVRSVKLKD